MARMSIEGVLSSNRLGVLILILLATTITAGAGAGAGAGDPLPCTSCSRELWRVLFGGATNLFTLFLCMAHWDFSHFPWSYIRSSSDSRIVAPLPRLILIHQFIMAIRYILLPQVCAARILVAAYAAMTMRQRLRTLSSDHISIAKRISPLIVWICIDKVTRDSLFEGHSTEREEKEKEKAVRGLFGKEFLNEAPNWKLAVPCPPGRCYSKSLLPEEAEYFYLCSQGWDSRNALWKEAMVKNGALWGMDQSMKMIEPGRPWWAGVLLVMQGVGYQASVASRLAQGLEVSPVEMMSVWMSLFVVVEAGIMPLFVIPSNRGICVHLDCSQFNEVLNYYVEKRHTQSEDDKRKVLSCFHLGSFLVCILFILFMFLILIPPLVYYYRKLPHSNILSFASLIPFTLLSGAGIIAFALGLFVPPQNILFAFTTVPSLPNSSKHIFSITIGFMVAGLASYVLAITETSMHWPRFQAADPSFFRFIIPHIGS